MDEAQLELLRSRLDKPVDLIEEEHIGIKNVHDRIRYYYGEPYGITIDSEKHKGTTITISLPYIVEED